MSRILDREGTFKAVPVSWAVQESEQTQSIALVIQFKVLAQLDGNDLVDWSEYEDHSIFGWFYVIKRDGTPNSITIKSLVESIHWNGSLRAVEQDPPQVTCQIVVENEEYNGKYTLKVKWINPEDFAPGPKSVSSAGLAQLDNRFGSLLRAAAAEARPKTAAKQPPAKTPPPAPRAAVQETVPPANPEDGLPFEDAAASGPDTGASTSKVTPGAAAMNPPHGAGQGDAPAHLEQAGGDVERSTPSTATGVMDTPPADLSRLAWDQLVTVAGSLAKSQKAEQLVQSAVATGDPDVVRRLCETLMRRR